MNERGRREKEGELFEQSAVHIFGEGEGQVQQLQCGHDKASSLPSVSDMTLTSKSRP